jgi:uncharacterized protein (DUF1684 family)
VTHPWLKASLVVTLLVSFVASIAILADTDGATAYEQQIAEWRARREGRLADPDGWMTLVGLEWLQEGENRVGGCASCTARIEGGPEEWGSVFVEGDTIRFVAAPDSAVKVDGEPVSEIRLVPDSQGSPTVVRSGDLSFHVIQRGSYALRVKDRKAPALLAFHGMPVYDIQPDWRVEGRFQRAPDGETIDIANVLGQVNPSPVYGTFEFDREGGTHRLLALGDSGSTSLWFLIADRTSGRETYGAGRFLYSDGMPEDGRLVVDFNKAYNPPCAFNDYSTCPLPPQQNRLDLAVRAGEKKYRH